MSLTMRSDSDYIQSYERAVAELRKAPGNQEFQRQAVLALASAGSLNFAIAEYERYGLDNVRHNEDIMALGGRLSKDLYLLTAGKKALEHARNSAAKYEAAFQKTQGYYSGVNAATMALMANMPLEMVEDRVAKILELLPLSQSLSPEEHYFIEATRAECFLLLDEPVKAEEALRQALTFDPLNYPAHASTLKQFKLILNKKQKNQTWLAACKPPKPMHFAGHIWGRLDKSSEDITAKISDIIQQHDIGFGYGALAAGADIVIAEAMLSEGVELNVLLPSGIDSFIEYSVRPFGDLWVPRFKACLERAQSCICLADTSEGISQAHNILSARMAMGQAILRSDQLDVSACQLLISNPNRSESLTSHHGKDWEETGLDQIKIPLNESSKIGKARQTVSEELDILIKSSSGPQVEKMPSVNSVISKIHNHHQESNSMLGLHFDMPSAEDELEAIMQKRFEGTVLVSEAIASYVGLKHKQDFKVIFAGTVFDKNERPIRSYTLQSLA